MSIIEALSLLGLAEGASLDDVEQAYRDLVRVWHPDRFAGDYRLQKKAQEHTQKLNDAVRQLRTSYDPRQSRGSARQRTAPTVKPAQPLRFAPFIVRPVLRQQGAFFLFSLFILLVGLDTFIRATDEPLWQFSSAILVVVALRMTARHLTALIVPLPRYLISERGVVFYDYGFIPWADLAGLSAHLAGPSRLSVRFKSSGVAKFSAPTKLLMALRRFVTKAELIVPVQGMSCHAVEIVRASTLFNQVDAPESSFPEAASLDILRQILFWSYILCSVCLLTLPWLSFTTHEDVIFLYAAVGGVICLVEEGVKSMRMRKYTLVAS